MLTAFGLIVMLLISIKPMFEQPVYSSRQNQAARYISRLPEFDFVSIPGGSFMMGNSPDEAAPDLDELPPHEVSIKPFNMLTTEVTQEQWETVMGHNPSEFRGEDMPVDNVSWVDIQVFLGVLNRSDSTHHYRLPTEAEWEYACRGGTTTKYNFGNDIKILQKNIYQELNMIQRLGL